jgi:lipopolysaccharide transport system ATP-binding protein
MNDIIVKFSGIGKRYRIRHTQSERYSALRDVIADKVRGIFHSPQQISRPSVEDFWALKDISFEVKRGEVLGIIGRNGAGKSTLLKILSRITDPTEGRVDIEGRVASLLEVGTGFHPELTGRENVYLNGAILGMSRAEIRRKFDEIVAFAEVEKFLDTPVKRYSSGMYVRLAFAVAAHLEPEILVVDEVLAVGDAEFQKKCLGKMDEVSQREGRTILFVSHNMGAMSSLCHSAIWIDSGTLRRIGATRDVINEYLVRETPTVGRVIDLSLASRSGVSDSRLHLESIEWLSDLPLRHGEPIKARIQFKARAPLMDITIGIGFSNSGGTRLLTYESDFLDGVRPNLTQAGSYSVDLETDSLPISPDLYYLDIGSRAGDFHPLDYVPAVAQIEVVAGPRTPGTIVRKGAGVRLESKWAWNRINELIYPFDA